MVYIFYLLVHYSEGCAHLRELRVRVYLYQLELVRYSLYIRIYPDILWQMKEDLVLYSIIWPNMKMKFDFFFNFPEQLKWRDEGIFSDGTI